MLDAPMGIVIGTIFLYDLLGMRIGLWSSVMFECSIFRCLLLLRSRRNMSISSHEPLCWKSGCRCATFIYVPEVWYLALNIYTVAQETLMKARDERVALMNEVR